MPYETFFDRYNTIHDDIVAGMHETTLYTERGFRPDTTKWTSYTPMVFYDKVLNDKDVLRQKAAFALSQIFVMKLITALEPRRIKGDGYAKYYDVLYEGAFGNFRDILGDKTDSDSSIQPDENYAREIMQLFTIGLFELNNDGTQKLDQYGEPIPTYTIKDIEEMAKVFTGLYGAAIDLNCEIYNCKYTFGRKVQVYDWNLPMEMEENYHDKSTKILPNGDTIPAGQLGMEDIDMALDWLFEHPNVGPFIARKLIQQLVKSNPTSGYINRVATAFNNNGNDVRGDMGAVFKAILLDPEARDCEWISHPHTGKLLQPMERNLNLFKAFGVHTPSGIIRFHDFKTSAIEGEELLARQAFLKSPSVFNFFSPDYAESEFIEPEGLVSPEFEILNSVTSIHYINRTRDMIERMGQRLDYSYYRSINNLYDTSPFMNISNYGGSSTNKIYLLHNLSDKPELDFRKEVCICEGDGTGKDIEALLDHLDIILCRGQLSTQTKDEIRNNITYQMNNKNSERNGLLDHAFT